MTSKELDHWRRVSTILAEVRRAIIDHARSGRECVAIVFDAPDGKSGALASMPGCDPLLLSALKRAVAEVWGEEVSNEKI
jgi:hypothetical protein